MDLEAQSDQSTLPPPELPAEPPPGLMTAAIASIGAGAIHAAAIGAHADHMAVVRLMVAAAVFQIGWGVATLWHPHRTWGAIGLTGNAVIVVAWLLTRQSGISYVDGLEQPESVGFPDATAAAFGIVAVSGATLAWLVGPRGPGPRRSWLAAAALVTAAIAAPAMARAATTVHDHPPDPEHEHAITIPG